MKDYFRYCVFVVFILITILAIAQTPPPQEGGEVYNVSFINVLIYPFLILGAYLVFRNRDKLSN